MECSYCKGPPPGGIVFLLEELVPGAGPQRKTACFKCIQELGEKIMRPLTYPEQPPTVPK